MDAAINCAVPPTCEELGYTVNISECASPTVLKCPFDETKAYCSRRCEPGSILYSDGKCYYQAPSGKTVVGVVFDAENRLAVSLSASKQMAWGGYGTDIAALDNCTNTYTAKTSCGVDGKANTIAIVSALGSGTDYAAGYCNSLTEGGKSTGVWFLPSLRELYMLYANKTIVNEGITAAGGATITSGYHWSSTEYSSYNARILNMSSGNVNNNNKSNTNNYVRCVVASLIKSEFLA